MSMPITESVNDATSHLDQCSTLEMCQLINKNDAQVAIAIERALPQIAAVIDAIHHAFAKGHRLFYIGAGTSGRLGVLDASECPPTFGTDPQLVQGIIAGGDRALRDAVEGVEDDSPAGVADVEAFGIQEGDVLVGISASGNPAYVVEALKSARAKGAVTAALVCNPDAAMITYADHAIVTVVGPEVLAGSSRLKAGTSQKLVLNMLTTGAMIKWGKTYGNLMVDVKASNEKLLRRALNLVMRVAGVDEAKAKAALDQCNQRVKPAILVASGKVKNHDAALALLDKHAGRLRGCLEE
jgi:N-acetylmuramic acid 6-phosphate etherase